MTLKPQQSDRAIYASGRLMELFLPHIGNQEKMRKKTVFRVITNLSLMFLPCTFGTSYAQKITLGSNALSEILLVPKGSAPFGKINCSSIFSGFGARLDYADLYSLPMNEGYQGGTPSVVLSPLVGIGLQYNSVKSGIGGSVESLAGDFSYDEIQGSLTLLTLPVEAGLQLKTFMGDIDLVGFYSFGLSGKWKWNTNSRQPFFQGRDSDESSISLGNGFGARFGYSYFFNKSLSVGSDIIYGTSSVKIPDPEWKADLNHFSTSLNLSYTFDANSEAPVQK